MVDIHSLPERYVSFKEFLAFKAVQDPTTCKSCRHPDKEVYLEEDNAGGHARASKIMEEYRNEHGILKAPHPPDSPDLDMIEGRWDYEKDRVEEYPTFGDTQDDVQQAKDYVTRRWRRAGPKAKQLCESFRSHLEP